MHSSGDFHSLSESFLGDEGHRLQANRGTTKHLEGIATAVTQFSMPGLAKERAAYYKWKVLESLDKYLIEFEASVIRRGGKVIWATDAESVQQEIETILKRNQVGKLLLCPSHITRETGLIPFLKKRNKEILIAGNADYIADKAGLPPFHMASPILQMPEEEISQLLNPGLGVSLEARAEEIVRDVSAEIRSGLQPDMAITGAQFLVAENGMSVLTENEGHNRLAVSLAKTLVVVAGIDALIPSMNDLDIFLPLLSSFREGEPLSAFNTLVGPRQPGETDGPGEFIVILTDNGRSTLLAQSDQRQVLSCIQCGACSSVCPVFNTIGGHAMTNGPVGAAASPHMIGLNEAGYASYASTLCGKCTAICPVQIDLNNHLLRNRRDTVHHGMIKSADKIMWFSWKKMMLSRKNMNRSASIRNFMLKSFLKSEWGENREFPKVVEKSFNQLWREKG